jgi:hypothetical protein
MAADLVPIRLGLTAGDRYTLWAPRWRDSGDEWEAFLGKDEDVYGFETPSDLVAFVRTDTGNDLVDHPGWSGLTEANAHKLDPDDGNQFDLVAVEEWVAEKPTDKSVRALADTLSVVASIGSVCDLAPVTKFFNGNPALGTLTSGMEHFTGRAGRKRWDSIGEIIGRNWDDVLGAIDAVVATPDVDKAAAKQATEELAADPPEEDDVEATEEKPAVSEDAGDAGDAADGDDAGKAAADDTRAASRATDDSVVLGSDEDFWVKVGIDPIQIMIGAGTFYTLRCYFDDEPLFLGRNGRISVFGSERALARYLADEHDHDLSDLSTYDDIRTAATDGSLAVDVADENVYVLSGLADDLADGPDAVDRDQLDLAVEFLRDVGEYAEDDSVDEALNPDGPLGRLVAYALDSDSAKKPKGPYAAAVKKWEELERFVESRLRRE